MDLLAGMIGMSLTESDSHTHGIYGGNEEMMKTNKLPD